MNTIIANLADMHSGSTKALCLDRDWEGEHQDWRPKPFQIQMHNHFIKCAEMLRNRGKKKLIIVNSGDAIDGYHHGSHELITRILWEQSEIHKELMEEFMTACKFSTSKGDRLVYVRGTETHTGEEESRIAADLGAEIADHVALNVNGALLWFVHDGATPGQGPNQGNGLRNNLKNIYYDCLEDNEPMPDLVAYAHAHQAVRNSYEGRRKLIRGYINPVWQTKTRFAYKVAPVKKSSIGMATVEVSEEGVVMCPEFHLMDFESAKTL